MKTDAARVEAVRAAARPLTGADDDHDALLALIGDARFVLLGEASHGTHDFYRERARITRRLIAERGFDAVAIEGDWPDASRVNRYVRGSAGDASARAALGGFRRFPHWMWRNTDVLAFVDWLRSFNDRRPAPGRAGFYGLDLYSLQASMGAVLEWLDQRDAAAARRVRDRYACFDAFGDDSQAYGLMTGLGDAPSCEEAVVATLIDVRRRAAEAAPGDDEAAFDAERNAELVRNAERYYRSMYLSDVSSWNQRDRHMMQMLDAIDAHLTKRQGRPARVVVWAHNSHIGDARATDMGWRRGELNIGQLVRERQGDAAFLVGFTTRTGTVTAASDWDAPAQTRKVVPSLAGSVEALLHDTGIASFFLPLRGGGAHVDALLEPLLERAIGVIYRPETERQSHYFPASVARQFDAVVHIDETRAVEPLEPVGVRDAEAPETYPAGV